MKSATLPSFWDSYRAIGIWGGDTVTWFWIGSHDDYKRYFG